MLRIHSLELTNICNLKCDHCPSSDSTYPKGFIDFITFENVMQICSNKPLTLSGFGESLLHPDLVNLLHISTKYNVLIIIPTNGILLTPKLLSDMSKTLINKIEISIHSPKSLVAYNEALNYVKKNYIPIKITANVLDCYFDYLDSWCINNNVSIDILKTLNYLTSHNWARNVRNFYQEKNIYWQEKCLFLKNNIGCVRWNGNVYTCCCDSDGFNYVGHLNDFNDLNFDKSRYKLCYKCSLSWFTGQDHFI